MAPESTTQRIVPGAPPPPPLTKSQLKKKRKAGAKPKEDETPVVIPDTTSAALVEKAPEPEDIREGSVALELVVTQPQSPAPKEEVKPSPIVELISKRLKATNKKIARITSYATADPSTLNEDQKRTLTTLPILEAVAKELGEVKKAVEAHESELAVELASKEREIVAAEKKRIAEAVSTAKAESASKTSEILSFLRLRTVIDSGRVDPFAFGISRAEVEAIFATADDLVGAESETKEIAVNAFLSAEGEFSGVPYSRLVEIVDRVFAPAPEPSAPEQAEEQPEAPEAPATPVLPQPVQPAQPDVVVGNVPLSTSGSFHFMQASELESPSVTFDNAHWVEPSEAVESSPAPETNGHVHVDETSIPEAAPAEVAPIDWAAEGEDDLPSIDGLHATFGKSGSATPVVSEAPQEAESLPPPNGAAVTGDANGDTSTPAADEDGFTQARGGRGRGRGFRGGDRGGFRGSFRGGDRGGFRGERGERGGFRGRGGDRSNGSRGRGEWRGDGEHRGRGGRGRGRGGDRHASTGSAPPTPA